MSCNYEPNRLAASNLLETYEKLFPRNKYKINASKKAKIDSENRYYLQQQQGSSKG